MKYIDEYRDRSVALAIAAKIKHISKKPIALMEVCGGHTMSIHKYGIPSLLPSNIKLLSGPGCPVCVTDRRFIDRAIAMSRLNDVIITSYGDLIRVPGSSSTLDKEKASGADIRMVYSVMESLEIARKNPKKRIVFLGIGFETTSPASAVGIFNAFNEELNNFFFLSSHKMMPPAMAALIDEGVKIVGYIAPGHVSTVTGISIYEFIPEKYKISVVVSGFEPTDILQSILMLCEQYESNSPKVEIQYKRVVKPEGNIKAQEMLTEVFEHSDDWWRGLGLLPNSGMKLRAKYSKLDAELMIDAPPEETREPKGCICGEILKGLKTPKECKLFGKACKPEDPVGSCMVSSEGACAAFYKYSNE